MSEAMRPVAWQYTTESGNEHYTAIKAKALQFDANPTPLYAAPPSTADAVVHDEFVGAPGIQLSEYTSTAEAQAMALEDAADCGEFSAWAKDRLLKMAKRIREEG